MIIDILRQLSIARKAAGLVQETFAKRAGLSRMTVQRAESGDLDPRLSTVLEMARSLGMELILVPKSIRPDVENFVRSSGRILGQPAGIGAPLSIADALMAEPHARKNSRQ